MRVWSPKTGVCKHVFSNFHEATVTCIDSTDDGEFLISGTVVNPSHTLKKPTLFETKMMNWLKSHVRLLIHTMSSVLILLPP